MAVRVSETMIFVRDMDEAIQFYTQKLGFQLDERFDWGFAYVRLDPSHRIGLMLESQWMREYPDDEHLPRPRVSIETDDFEGMIRHLHHTGVQHSTISMHPGGVRAATFYDTDQNAFLLWSDPAASWA